MVKANVELRNITKIFDSGRGERVVAVDSLDLEIAEGELVTLLGPSGCGKTTTLRMIGGFETPTAGDILLDGVRVNDAPPNRRDTAMVFQSYALFPHMNVFNNVAYGLRVKGRGSAKEIERQVRRMLELVGLAGLENRSAANLSGGQQQRVALARALVMEPRVLLFDEPLSNLDAMLRVQMRREIRNVQKQLGITSVYVTHDQEEAMSLSDRIVVMNEGRIEQVGTPQAIYSRPESEFVAGFIGRHTNFLPARIKEKSSEGVVVDVLGHPLQLPGYREMRPGQKVRMVVRPEGIQIESAQDGAPKGRVSVATYLGAQVLYEVEFGGRAISVEVQNPQENGIVEPGGEVALRFLPNSVHLLAEAG